ncbi:DUF58 domain-containing protein [Kytococcus sedentarius]|uniref:DUF58 domain-containing protein n=1 Tax=Kytococcus sedentarius TaxID=1276 RepID=UPI0035BBBEBA
MAAASASASSRRVPGLTLRGWVLVLAGLLLVGVGQYFGLGDLSRLGVLLVALPALAWLLGLGSVRTTHTDLDATPATPRAGDPVDLRVATRSTAPLPGAPVVAHLPVHGTWGPTIELGTLAVRSQETVQQVTVRPTHRGRYEVGPVLMDRSDPFGLTRQALTESGEALTVTVLPRTVDYPGARVRRLVQDAAQRTVTMRPTTDAVDAAAVREYGRGDDVRRIHWRSTARTGDLMVRHDDTEVKPWLLICVDEGAPWGAAPEGSTGPYPGPPAFEAAVRVAATLVESAARAGLEVRLLTAAGMTDGLHQRAVRTPDALAHLAAVAPRDRRPEDFAQHALAATRSGGLPFLVTAGHTPADTGALGERHPRHPGTALLVGAEPAGGTPSDRRETAAFALRRGGWRVASWSELGDEGGAPGRPAGGDRSDPSDAALRRAMDLLTRATSRGETA